MDLLAGKLEELYGEMIAEYQAGGRPQPDLANLPTYLDVGLSLDRDEREAQADPDLNGGYRHELARRHSLKAIPADKRLWEGRGR
jgi:hypothetical protein